MTTVLITALLNRHRRGVITNLKRFSGLASSRRFSAMGDQQKVKDRPKVYVTRVDIPEAGLDLLAKTCDVTVWPKTTPIPKDELVKNIRGKDALFCLLTDKIDVEVLRSAGPSLKVIATMSAGYDHISLQDVKERKIKLGYTPDTLTDATAELTVALLLATSRRLMEANAEVHNGGWKSWSPQWMCGPGIAGATIGVVGFGRIGQEVCRKLAPFKFSRLLYCNRTARPKEAQEVNATKAPLDQILTECDIIVVTIALTPETHNMFDKSAFARMKSNCIFVNTSRGAIVDQEALIEALASGTIAMAGLDVTTPEPLPLDSPLLKMKNCVVLPHIGSARIDTRTEMSILTAHNILSALDNKPMPSELHIK